MSGFFGLGLRYRYGRGLEFGVEVKHHRKYNFGGTDVHPNGAIWFGKDYVEFAFGAGVQRSHPNAVIKRIDPRFATQNITVPKLKLMRPLSDSLKQQWRIRANPVSKNCFAAAVFVPQDEVVTLLNLDARPAPLLESMANAAGRKGGLTLDDMICLGVTVEY